MLQSVSSQRLSSFVLQLGSSCLLYYITFYVGGRGGGSFCAFNVKG